MSLSFLLAHLPHEVVAKEFGSNALIWTWVTYPYTNNVNDDLEISLHESGINIDSLQKARLTAWRLHGSQNTQTVLKTYDLIQALHDTLPKDRDLNILLKSCTKQGVGLSEERIKQYSLEPLITEGVDTTSGWAKNWGHDKTVDDKNRLCKIYLDSPVGVALMYKGEPNALASFSPSDEKTLFINQIQGVESYKLNELKEIQGKIHSRGLVVLDWEKLLVQLSEIIAKKFNLSQTIIQSGHNNTWTTMQNKDGTPKLPLEKALKRYDETASRLGYLQGENRNWYKSI